MGGAAGSKMVYMIFHLFVQFSTPDLLLPDFVPIYPTTYLTYKVSAIDGKSHSVRLYYDNTAEVSICVCVCVCVSVSGEHVMGVCVEVVV